MRPHRLNLTMPLGPFVVNTLGISLSATQIGNAVLATKAIQNDPDLLSDEYCLRVARLISLTFFSLGLLAVYLMSTPQCLR